MSAHKIIYLIVGLVAGFLIGFAFANGVNRSEQDAMRAELARLRSEMNGNSSGDAKNNRARIADKSSETMLTDDELRKAIAKGDANPNDTTLQRNLGRGLYLYAMNSGQTAILPDAVRLLKRAYEAEPDDYETIVLLGQALFDVGQNGDSALIHEARQYFTKALEIKPDDINVRTELGLTYYFVKPPDPPRAIREYRKSLAINPRHEMTLQSLAAALIATGETTEAQKTIDALQDLNSSNAALPNLRAQLAQSKNAHKERN